jgi:hypothetical protein
MATKTKTKTETNTKKPESKSTKAETTKTETKSSEASSTGNDTASDAASDTASDSASDASTGSGGGKSSTSSRPISYFSSVSTDDYRSGWDGVFGNGAETSKAKPAKRAAKAASKLPMTITLEAEDLDADIREQLETIFRKQAKKKRLNYDKLSGNGQVSLQVSCRISGS